MYEGPTKEEKKIHAEAFKVELTRAAQHHTYGGCRQHASASRKKKEFV